MYKIGRTVRICFRLLILFFFVSFCFFFVSFCVIEMVPPALATTFYVATNGNDSYNGLYPSYQSGSNGPFRTLSRAANVVQPGDTVKIRGGIYRESTTWYTNGTEANPITITNYNGETVIVDGNNHTIPSEDWGVLLKIAGNWYTVSNLEIRYSSCYGLLFKNTAEHCTAYNIYAHHNWRNGITCSGSYGVIENCKAYYNSMIHEWGTGSKWSSGIAVCRTPSYCKVRNCIAWNNWGQGIDNYESHYATVEDCIAYDNMANFYLSDARYCTLQRNISYFSSDNLLKDHVGWQIAIMLGDEVSTSSNNTIINNLSLGGQMTLYIGSNSFENSIMANNTGVNADIWAGNNYTVRIGSGSYANAKFQNNIILQENNVNIATNGAAGIDFGYNCWSKSPPGDCQGIGDIVSNPQLAKTGSTGPGLLTSQWFKILENSPAKDRATVLGQVSEDFFKTLRGSAPDMGAIELTNGPSPLTASALASPTSGQAPLTVLFTGSASGGTSPYSYRWTFGDGGSSTAQNPSHTYSFAGNFTATLTVTDSASSQDSDPVTINVTSGTETRQLTLSTTTGAPASGNGGTTNPAPGTHSYPLGDSVSVRAIHYTNYRFSIWNGDVVSAYKYNENITINMNSNKSLSAFFCTRCGDPSGDLNITAFDSQVAFDIYLRRISNPSQCEFENADVDCNGIVSPGDSQAIFNKYLGIAELPADCSDKTRTMATEIISMQAEEPSATLLAIEDVQVNRDGYVFVPIIIDNPIDIDAFGFDLVFPSNVLTFLILENAELTEGYEQLDSNVISFQDTNHKILRVGGYNIHSDQTLSSGVLVTLVFKVTGEFKDPIPLSVIATYDDIKNVSTRDGIIKLKDNTQFRINNRLDRNSEKKLPDKKYDF
jgi:parallel beta-helix repeat protein